MREHRKAIEYDLVSRTGYTINDIGRSLDWGALSSFIENLGFDSALMRELEPEYHIWDTRAKTNAILADIYDVLAMINVNLVSIGSGKKAKRPKPYNRPGSENETTKKIGSGALPVKELEEWIEKKRQQYVKHD